MRKIAHSVAAIMVLSAAFVVLFSVKAARTDAVDYYYYNGTSSSQQYIGGVDIAVTDDRTQVAPSRPLEYTVTLSLSPSYPNYGKTIDVDLLLPPQVTFVSATNGGFYTVNRSVHWSQIVVTRGEPVKLKVQTQVPATASENSMLVSKATTENTEASDTTTVTREAIEPGNAFLATLDVPSKFVKPGSDVTYTLKVRNISALTTATTVTLTKSPQSQLLAASDYPKIDRDTIDWGTLVFTPGETKTFTVRAHIDERLPDNLSVRTRVMVGGMQVARDIIIKRAGAAPNTISASITDGRETVERGEVLTYLVHASNTADVPAAAVDIFTSLPIYGDFLSADQGGSWDGTNVRWIGLTIAPHSSRDLRFSVRVRPDASFGSRMQTSVSVAGMTIARDETEVVRLNTDGSTPAVYSTRTIEPMIAKSIDNPHPQPGSHVRVTLIVRNPMSFPLSDMVVIDRYNPAFFALDSQDPTVELTRTSRGQLKWAVPTIAPGASWTMTYTLAVSPSAPQGITADTRASLSGSGIDQQTLYALNTQPVTQNQPEYEDETPAVVMPTTGVDIVSLSALILACAAGAAAVAHKRKIA